MNEPNEQLIDKNVLQLAVIDGYVDHAKKDGYSAPVTLHALNIMRERFASLLEERQGLLREMEARDRENDLTCKMLEQVKAERDDWKNQLKSLSDTAWDSALENMKVMNENVVLRTELSELKQTQKAVRKCMACNGSGRYDSHGSPPCGACDGTGEDNP